MADSVIGQVAALKSAYATLSEVLVEETDACRQEIAAVQHGLSDRGREIGALQEGEQRLGRSHRALEGSLADARRDIGRVDAKADAAMDAIEALQRQLAELSARCDAADHRAAVAEAAADNAAAAARVAQAEAGELRAALDASSRDHERFARDVDARVRAVHDAVRDAQSSLSTTIAAGIAGMNGAIERGNRDLVAHGSQIADLGRAVTALKAQAGEADTALAKDLAMLADALTTTRSALASEVSALNARVTAVSTAGEESHRMEAEERERRLASVARGIEARLEEVAGAVAGIRDTATASRAAADERSSRAGSDLRTLATQLASLEALTQAQLADVGRRIDDTSRSAGSRLDAMSQAMHAFANVLNLGQLVVDPKAVLTRSLSATGVTPAGGAATAASTADGTAAPGRAGMTMMPTSTIGAAGGSFGGSTTSLGGTTAAAAAALSRPHATGGAAGLLASPSRSAAPPGSFAAATDAMTAGFASPAGGMRTVLGGYGGASLYQPSRM